MAEENIETLRRSINAWNRGDLAEALSDHAPDVEWHTSGEFADRGVYRGHAGLERLWREVEEDVEGLRFLVTGTRAVGDRVLVAMTMAGRGRLSKAPFEQPSWHVVTFRDGLIARVDTYVDPSQATQALEATESASPQKWASR